VIKNLRQNKTMSKYKWEPQYLTQENGQFSLPVKEAELDCDILEKVKEITVFAKQLENRKVYLEDKIHTVDLEIVDIEHAAEFYVLSASQGYKLYKLLHDARNERRQYKNELEKINLFLNTSIKSGSMERLERSILGMNNRKYAPRVNKELFGV
jgi:hypothetical protein